MELQGKSIAVTGASGMLGVYICRALLRKGATVIGVVRNPQKAAFLAEEGVEFRQADLMDRDALQKAFEGCDSVVSNAAMYVASKSMSAFDEHDKANRIGTENVFEACAAANVKRAVHVSTFGIYRFSLFRMIFEDSPQLQGEKKQGGPYRATKQISEKLAWEIAERNNIALTTVRPTGVYGARDWNLLQPIYKLMRSPVLPAPSFSFPLVYAGDVANAIAAALHTSASENQAYNTGGNNLPVSQFLRAVKKGLSNGPFLIPLPLPMGIRIDNSKAEKDLGFQNRPFDECLHEIWQEESPPAPLKLLA